TFQAFDFIVAKEHAREAGRGAVPRRMIGINVVNNRFEAMFDDAVSITLTPYSSRVRHGFIVPTLEYVKQRAVDLNALRQEIAVELGRTLAMPMSELLVYKELLGRLAADPADVSLLECAASVATPLLALLARRDGR